MGTLEKLGWPADAPMVRSKVKSAGFLDLHARLQEEPKSAEWLRKAVEGDTGEEDLFSSAAGVDDADLFSGSGIKDRPIPLPFTTSWLTEEAIVLLLCPLPQNSVPPPLDVDLDSLATDYVPDFNLLRHVSAAGYLIRGSFTEGVPHDLFGNKHTTFDGLSSCGLHRKDEAHLSTRVYFYQGSALVGREGRHKGGDNPRFVIRIAERVCLDQLLLRRCYAVVSAEPADLDLPRRGYIQACYLKDRNGQPVTPFNFPLSRQARPSRIQDLLAGTSGPNSVADAIRKAKDSGKDFLPNRKQLLSFRHRARVRARQDPARLETEDFDIAHKGGRAPTTYFSDFDNFAQHYRREGARFESGANSCDLGRDGRTIRRKRLEAMAGLLRGLEEDDAPEPPPRTGMDILVDEEEGIRVFDAAAEDLNDILTGLDAWDPPDAPQRKDLTLEENRSARLFLTSLEAIDDFKLWCPSPLPNSPAPSEDAIHLFTYVTVDTTALGPWFVTALTLVDKRFIRKATGAPMDVVLAVLVSCRVSSDDIRYLFACFAEHVGAFCSAPPNTGGIKLDASSAQLAGIRRSPFWTSIVSLCASDKECGYVRTVLGGVP